MSARFPSIATPELATPRAVVFHGMPESMLGICWERGYATKLIEPDLQADTIKVEITATRRQIQEARREDDRRVSQYHQQDWREPQPPDKTWERGWVKGQPWQWRVRCYFEPDVIADVLRERGLAGKIMHLRPYHCFRMVAVVATRPEFRAAQFTWLERMMKKPSTPIPCEMEDLF